MRQFCWLVAALVLCAANCRAQRIEVTIPALRKPVTGHLILVFAKTDKPEPRMQMNEDYQSAQGFGVDVSELKPGAPIVVNAKTFGYPRRSLADLDAGDYYVQAVFNVYELFQLGDGRNLWLPPDKGEGQHWYSKPGNPYNRPVKLHFDPKAQATIRIALDQVIAPIAGTDRDPEVLAQREPGAHWLQYMRFKSAALSKFWGRDMYLGAWMLLPDGFDRHPQARYPLVVYQDHFYPGFRPYPWVTSPPAADASPREKDGYRFFQDWTSGRLPRVILIYVQSANPYYDDSYDVDSANVGPYGMAINDELIPAIEKKYRGIGQGWARATFGGSTGGWEALATQIFYPTRYNGTYAACPDPVDFHAYQNIDLYNDTNAFTRQGDFGQVPIAADRKADGSIIANTGPEYAYEYVLGTHGRSTEQWDIWQAVFSPVGPDGYPAQVIDPLTGAIDSKVVALLVPALRFDRDDDARLGDAGAGVGGQGASGGGRRRYVFPEQRSAHARGAVGADAASALRCDLPVRPAHAALLHRRPGGLHHGTEQCRLAAAGAAADGGAYAGNGAAGRRYYFVALLSCLALRRR